MTHAQIPLEERLSEFGGNSEVVDVLKKAVSGPYVDPREVKKAFRDDKLDIAKGIERAITECGITLQHPDFGGTLYHGKFIVDQLNRVLYGMYSTEKLKIANVLNVLTDYEKIYFFAGVWCKRGQPELLDKLPSLVSEYIMAGINILRGVYSEAHGGSESDLKEIPEYFRIKEENERMARMRVAEREQREHRRSRVRADIDG